MASTSDKHAHRYRKSYGKLARKLFADIAPPGEDRTDGALRCDIGKISLLEAMLFAPWGAESGAVYYAAADATGAPLGIPIS